MNFYGHLTVATWTREGARSARFGLGSMLPDFAGMVGARPPEAHPTTELAAGITHHHDVDAVFHATPSFLALCREGAEAMRGARRGTVRAAAHIGAELFLDGWLLHRQPRREAYLGALEAGAPDAAGEDMRWRQPESASRFERLRARLLAFGVPDDHDAGAVFGRLERTLRARPRLRIEPEDAERIRAGLEVLGECVDARAPALVEELREGLVARERALGRGVVYDAA